MSINTAIIGAGIAGVAAAQRLRDAGHTVTLLEKSRGFGGRCATKRWEGCAIDHGAQYFTLRDARFAEAVRQASGEALQRLEAPVADENGEPLPDSGRWFHRDGNSRLVRDLAAGLEIRTGVMVSDAAALLRAQGGEFDQVLSTAPWPQTATLFGLPVEDCYIPCLTAVLAWSGEWPGLSRTRYALSDRTGPLAWSACENHKPGRIAPGLTVIVAQMSETWSRSHLNLELDALPALIRLLVESRWELPAAAYQGGFGHRWRYARISRQPEVPVLPAGCYFAGDARTASRVEDAWLAGHLAAEQMLHADT